VALEFIELTVQKSSRSPSIISIVCSRMDIPKYDKMCFKSTLSFYVWLKCPLKGPLKGALNIPTEAATLWIHRRRNSPRNQLILVAKAAFGWHLSVHCSALRPAKVKETPKTAV